MCEVCAARKAHAERRPPSHADLKPRPESHAGSGNPDLLRDKPGHAGDASLVKEECAGADALM